MAWINTSKAAHLEIAHALPRLLRPRATTRAPGRTGTAPRHRLALRLRDEWPDLQAICRKLGATLIGVQAIGVVPAFTVEVLCPDPDTTLALMEQWLEFSATSPHRPRTDGERQAFNRKRHPFPDIPRDQTF